MRKRFHNPQSAGFTLSGIDKGHHLVTYRGVPAVKCPFDYVIYQMILTRLRPDLIIEIGTHRGGSALYYADLCDLNGKGMVHTVDIEGEPDEKALQHPRIRFFRQGWEKYPPDEARKAGLVLVIEDSSHTYQNTLAVLNAFHDFVSPGSYFIVEDGIIDRLGRSGQFDGGPVRAIREFLALHPDFEIDRQWCDFFGDNATFNVDGYLKRRH